MMRLDLATAEYIGARAQQQDHAAAVPFPSGAVLILADGLGGHESGAEASRIVVDTFREATLSGRFDAAETRRQALRETLEAANQRIADGVDPAHGHRGMASTVVAAVISAGDVRWVSVGDSHLYIWRNGRLAKLNEDHSQAGLMIRSGQYKATDPEVQAVKSVLVSALTGRKLEIVDLPQQTFRLEPGDVLMLASDGLNTLPDGEIESIVAAQRPNGAVRLSTVLLETVRSRRIERQDNTTVAVARVLEAVAKPERDLVVRAEPMTEAVTREISVPILREPEARTERVEASPALLDDAPPTEEVASAAAAVPVPEVPAATPVTPSAAAAEKPPTLPTAAAVAAPPALPAAPPVPTASPATAAPASAGAKAPSPKVAHGGAVATDPAPAKPAVAAPVADRARHAPPGPVAETRSAPAALGPDVRTPRVALDEVAPVKPRRSVIPVLGLLLGWLVAGAIAVAAVAALKPEWLAGWLPGAPETVHSPADATVAPGSEPKAAPPAGSPQPSQTTSPATAVPPAQLPPNTDAPPSGLRSGRPAAATPAEPTQAPSAAPTARSTPNATGTEAGGASSAAPAASAPAVPTSPAPAAASGNGSGTAAPPAATAPSGSQSPTSPAASSNGTSGAAGSAPTTPLVEEPRQVTRPPAQGTPAGPAAQPGAPRPPAASPQRQ